MELLEVNYAKPKPKTISNMLQSELTINLLLWHKYSKYYKFNFGFAEAVKEELIRRGFEI